MRLTNRYFAGCVGLFFVLAFCSSWAFAATPPVKAPIKKPAAANADLSPEIAVLIKKAEQDDAEAQTSLGVYYVMEDTLKDYHKAVFWFQKAAEHGFVGAQYNLAQCYDQGIGVVKDYHKAVFWYEKAAEHGFVWAQYNLANCYDLGIGVSQDHQKAVFWLQKAAEQGFAKAQYNLGTFYFLGKNHIQDYQKAVFWYEKAAEQGLVEAQYELGKYSIPENLVLAYQWLSLAAEKNNSDKNIIEKACKLRDFLKNKLTFQELQSAQIWINTWQPKPTKVTLVTQFLEE